MKPERWQQVERLCNAALECKASERAAYLKEVCGEDEALRREVESLLKQVDQAESFIEAPALEVAAQSMAAGGPPSLVGRQLGAYQILSPLGVGGMGEVYKARDIRLQRMVAIKVLPRHLSERADLRQRFEREARTLANLSHPHICPIYDVGQQDGVDFLVMEYLDGETLSQRLSKGVLPLDQSLRIALEIAGALDQAHRHGVIHRDLKPGNIMLTKAGAKLLDFGLAKRHAVAGLGEAGPGALAPATGSLTEEGLVLGTLEYMAPEQVEGKETDARTDIFAFGVFLYEMVTGRKAFTGKSKASLAAAILSSEPPSMSELKPQILPALERLIGRCLKKDPEDRWQHMRDVANELKWIAEEVSLTKTPKVEIDQELPKTVFRRVLRSRLLIGVGLLLLLAGGALWLYLFRSRELPPMKVIRLTSFPGKETEPALSPDGKMVAFVWDGEKGDNLDIYVMLVEAGTPLRLTTDPGDDFNPTWSPDGRFLAFRRRAKEKSGIYLIPSLGGPERRLIEEDPATITWNGGLDWSPDGKYLAVSASSAPLLPSSLFMFSVETGEKKRITMPSAGIGDFRPAFSPGGQTLAFSRPIAYGSHFDLYTIPVQGREPKRLTFDERAYGPAWTPDGREIIFSRWIGGGLYRVSASGGKAAPLVEGGQFGFFPSVSRQGNRLAYSEAIYDTDIWRIGLPSTKSKVPSMTPLISSSQMEISPQFSPDGKKITFNAVRSGSPEIWICDSDGRNPVQLTSFGGPFITGSPSWSPDGRFIAFDSSPRGPEDIFVISAEGGSPRRLTDGVANNVVPSWSRDGHWIYYGSKGGDADWQIWKKPVNGGKAIQVTRNGGFEASESLDGKFIFYSKEFLSNEIWMAPVSRGEESLFVMNVEFRYRAVAERGIYFITKEDREYAIKFIDFEKRQVTPIARLPKKIEMLGNGGLALSPDGRSLLCTLVEQDSSDIMLIENFR